MCSMALAPTLWLAVCRPADFRHNRGERLDRVCLCRRRDAAGPARRARSACWARRSAPASCSVRRSADWPAASRRGCRSGSPAGLSLANAALRAAGAAGIAAARAPRARFAWRRANPFGALALLRSHTELFGLRLCQFPRQSRPCRAAEHQRALHAVPLRLGRAHGRFDAGGASGSPRSSCRAASSVRSRRRFGERVTLMLGLGFGVAGFLVFALARKRRDVLARHSADGAVGARGPGLHGPDEPVRRRLGAGPASGRQCQRQRHRQHVRARHVHADIRCRDRRRANGISTGAPFVLAALVIVCGRYCSLAGDARPR